MTEMNDPNPNLGLEVFDQEWEQSALELSLGKKGWRHLTNVDPNITPVKFGDLILAESRLYPQTDEEIKEEYLDKGFEQVHVTDAYDINGREISGYRAVYVKGEKRFI